MIGNDNIKRNNDDDDDDDDDDIVHCTFILTQKVAMSINTTKVT